MENAKNLGRSDDPKRRKKRGWPNNVGPAGAESLAAALKTNTTLTNLDLSSNNLGPVGAESLGKALETNTALRILSFWQGNIIIISVHKKIDDAHGERIPSFFHNIFISF